MSIKWDFSGIANPDLWITDLQERLNRAEVALAKYARHLDTCHTKMHGDTCTCGLRRALEKP